MSARWLVAWDFVKRPKTTFYDIYANEFPDVERVQKSVALCRDEFVAARLVALLEYYGAHVVSFLTERRRLSAEQMQEANEFVERIHSQRLHRRGRKPIRRKRH